MTASNRVRLSFVRETTPGTTPDTPRMRKARWNSESLAYVPTFSDSEEVRDDRMSEDPAMVFKEAKGGVADEFSFPVDNSWHSELIRSAMFSPWTNTPVADNDGTADSVITAVANTNGILTAAFSAAVAVGHLVRTTGFVGANNNAINRCTTGSATVPRFAAANFTDEAAPPADARAKVVGFQGVAGDITATADGLASTTLDFTTLGIVVGQWLKNGGTAAGDKFATAALNDWIRVTAIAAHAITADNLPTGWATDDGAAKTIKVWFGDQIKNGTTQTALTLEKGFLGQAVPTYIAHRGQTVNTYKKSLQSRNKIKIDVAFQGMGGSQSTAALDASPDEATTAKVMSCNINVGKIAEAGSRLTSPNWAKSLEFTINNNLRADDAADVDTPVKVDEGECTVTGRMDTYFGDNSLLTKFHNGTATSVNVRANKNSQAIIWQFPRVTYRDDGNPQAGGKNQTVMLPLGFQASKDTLTAAHVVCDRLEYYE